LLLLLLKLLLELGRDGRHRGHGGLEGARLLGLGEAGILGLELGGAGLGPRRRLHGREAGVLLLERRRLSVAGGLGRKGAGLLGLLGLLAGDGAKGVAAILRLAGIQIPAQIRVLIGIHGSGRSAAVRRHGC